MEWRANEGLAKRILQDIAGDLQENQKEYLKKTPHVSELVYCLTRSWYNRFSPLPYTPNETLLFTTGIALERVLLRPHKKGKAGEVDGIFWSADFLDYVEGIGELKSTRKGSAKFPEEIPATWLRQMLSYMKAQDLTEVDLVVLHLMGNYAPPFPTLAVWHGEASINEIEDNWQWMLARKEIYLRHAKDEKAPKQFTYNEDWECDYCGYKILCEANQAVDARG